MEFKERLKQYRLDNNLTQDDLAKQLFVSRQAISKYETGRSYPNLETMQDIAKLLNVSLDELISKEEVAKETILTSHRIQNNRKSIFLLMGVLCIGIVISLISIFLSIQNRQEPAKEEPISPYRYVGFVGSINLEQPKNENLLNYEVFGYCCIYNKFTKLYERTYFNTLNNYNLHFYNEVTSSNNFIEEMQIMLSNQYKKAKFYKVYFDLEQNEYLFEEYIEVSLYSGKKLEFDIEGEIYSFQFVCVDKLKTLVLYEYDKGGNCIQETTDILEREPEPIYGGPPNTRIDYTLNSDTLYIVIEEMFEDENETIYYNRQVIYNYEVDKTYLYPIKKIKDNGFCIWSILFEKY